MWLDYFILFQVAPETNGNINFQSMKIVYGSFIKIVNNDIVLKVFDIVSQATY